MDKKKRGLVLGVSGLLLLWILILALAQGFNLFTARIRVDGFTMEPALPSGSYVIVNKLSYLGEEPQRGDIIVFHFPGQPEEEYIKRVIGLPGDDVQISDGVVSINGVELDEPYIKAAPAYRGAWSVPPGALFVLGDNRNNSSDSHNWGWVLSENVVGKAVFVYWPQTLWGPIEGPSYED